MKAIILNGFSSKDKGESVVQSVLAEKLQDMGWETGAGNDRQGSMESGRICGTVLSKANADPVDIDYYNA